MIKAVSRLTRSCLIVSVIFFAGCTPKAPTYTIDNSISRTIDSIFQANTLFHSALKPEFAFHTIKTFDYDKFEGDEMDLAYLLRTDSVFENEYVNSSAECYLDKDSIIVVGVLAYGSGIGFKIKIFGNSYTCETSLLSEEKVYVKNTGSLLDKEIMLKAEESSMTLSANPKFTIGSAIKGRLALQTEPFFQVGKDQKPFKIFGKFDIIFDTEIKER